MRAMIILRQNAEDFSRHEKPGGRRHRVTCGHGLYRSLLVRLNNGGRKVLANLGEHRFERLENFLGHVGVDFADLCRLRDGAFDR